MKTSSRRLSAILLVLTIAIAACGSSKGKAAAPGATTSTAHAPARTVAAVVAYDRQLSTFATMLNVSGVLASIGARGPYTVFAPNNDAFASLPHARLTALLSRAGKQDLAKLIGGHIVRGRVLAKDLQPGSLKSLSGARLTITKKGDVVTVTSADGGAAKVVSGPMTASNGVVFRVDAVHV